MNTHQIFVEIRKRLDNPKNWCSRGYKNEDGGYCIGGHWLQITGAGTWSDFSQSEACKILMGIIGRRRLPGYNSGVPHFNDTHSHNDVLLLLDEAIKKTGLNPQSRPKLIEAWLAIFCKPVLATPS